LRVQKHSQVSHELNASDLITEKCSVANHVPMSLLRQTSEASLTQLIFFYETDWMHTQHSQ